MNKKKMNGDKERQRELISSFEESYEDEDVGFDDLNELLERVRHND
jgi:hypothetical protein